MTHDEYDKRTREEDEYDKRTREEDEHRRLLKIMEPYRDAILASLGLTLDDANIILRKQGLRGFQ